MIKGVPTLKKILPYVDQGLVSRVDRDHLSIFNYTRKCTYEHTWDDVSLACRGLIYDTVSKNVVALPFTKFFNHGEHGIVVKIPHGKPDCVTVKMDGSLGISYRFNDKLCWSTRGTFFSPQAAVAQRIWDSKYAAVAVPRDWTLLVEIVSPETKNVVDHKFEDLILLGIRNNQTGEDLSQILVEEIAAHMGLQAVKRVDLDFDDAVKAAAKMTHQEEGFVLRWGDHRVKVKSLEYMAVARLLQGLTPRTIGDLWYASINPDGIPGLPEEHRDNMRQSFQIWDAEVVDVKNAVQLSLQINSDVTDRKTFVERVRSLNTFPLIMQSFSSKNVDYHLHVYRRHFDGLPRQIDLSSVKEAFRDE